MVVVVVVSFGKHFQRAVYNLSSSRVLSKSVIMMQHCDVYLCSLVSRSEAISGTKCRRTSGWVSYFGLRDMK
jgi:hypothetical protein